MISTYQLKSRFQSLLRPLAARLARVGITANQITLSTCLISLLTGALVAWQIEHNYVFLIIFLWFPLRMAGNALDGLLAREFGHTSRLGAVLNEICDVISDVALALPFALVAGTRTAWVIAVVLLAVVSEFAGLLAAALGGDRAYDGPMGKSDRAALFSLVALLIGCGIPIEAYLDGLWLVVIALLLLTIINRCRRAVHGKGNR